MLPKKARLNRDDFNQFFSKGIRHQSKSFQLVFVRAKTPRVSVVVPKKSAPKAVDRNRIRRRIYAIVRNASRNGVFIFIAKPSAARRAYTELAEEVEDAIHKATSTS